MYRRTGRRARERRRDQTDTGASGGYTPFWPEIRCVIMPHCSASWITSNWSKAAAGKVASKK